MTKLETPMTHYYRTRVGGALLEEFLTVPRCPGVGRRDFPSYGILLIRRESTPDRRRHLIKTLMVRNKFRRTRTVRLLSWNTIRHDYPPMLMLHEDRNVRFRELRISNSPDLNPDPVWIQRMTPKHSGAAVRAKMKFDDPPGIIRPTICL
jgi:hypothetical protein